MERRRQLLDELRRIEETAQDLQARGSLVDARDKLAEGLRLFLQSEVALSSEAKEILTNLLALAEQKERLALGTEEPWKQAQEMLAQLGQLSSQGWEANEASKLAWRWAQLTRDQSLRGIIRSRTQIKQFREAYRAALVYLNLHSEDKEALQQLAQAEENLLNQVAESTKKRLRTARQAQERGDYDTALDQLKELEQFCQEEIDAKFPNLLSGVDEIEQLRQEAKVLAREVRELQQAQAKVLPNLEKAEKAFQDDRLEEADELLQSLPRPGLSAQLTQRIQELEENLVQARRRTQIQKLRQILIQAEFDLKGARSVKDAERIRQSLEDLAQQIDLFDLPEEKVRYDQIIKEVNQLQTDLEEGQVQEQKAGEHVERGEFQKAVEALERALDATRDPAKRSELQGRLSKAKAQAAKQRETAEFRQQGEKQFQEGKYREARWNLLEAQKKGDTSDRVLDLIQACRAGMLWQDAEQMFEQQEKEPDPEKRLLLLQDLHATVEQASHPIKNNSEADDIRDRLDMLRGKIDRRLNYIKEKVKEARQQAQLEQERKIQKETEIKLQEKRQRQEKEKVEREIKATIRQALEALNNEDTDRAKEVIQPALDRASEHQEAWQIYEEILIAERAKRTIEEAQALMEEGDYGKARSHVQGVLADVTDKPNLRVYLQKATSLQQTIETGYEANTLLLLAEHHAEQKQFQQARKALEKAIATGGASRERITQVQKRLDRLEQEWESQIFDPIKDHQRKQEHEEAYNLCQQALGQVAALDFRKRLEHLRAEIVRAWVETSLDRLRQEFYQVQQDKARLDKIAAELDRLAALQPAKHQSTEIEQLSNKVHTSRLEIALAEVETLIHQENWDQALDRLDEIKKEARELDLVSIAKRVMNLRRELITRQENVQISRQRTRREELLREAWQIWKTSQGRVDLERVYTLAGQVLELPRYEKDREAQNLQRDAQQEIENFNRTEEAIRKGRQEIFNRRYEEAEKILSLTSVSRLLQKEYERWVDLARILVQADKDQISRSWADALQGYQQAIELEPQLAPRLRDDQEFCRAQIMEKIVFQAQQYLAEVPPQADRARTLLEHARAEGWVVSTFQTKVDRLLEQCQGQGHIAHAAEILKRPDGDPRQALEELKLARKQLPDGQKDDTIRHWETLAQAILAWPDDLDMVEAQLKKLEAGPLRDLNRVHRLRQDLERERWEDARRREEQERQRQFFRKFQTEIREALNASPPRYDEAIQTARQASQQITDGAEELILEVQSHLQASIGKARSNNDYDQVIRLAKLLPDLDPNDEQASSLAGELAAERQARLAEAIQKAQQAMQVYDLPTAERSIQLATQLAGSKGDPALDVVRQDWQKIAQLQQKIHTLLRQAKQAAREERWSEVNDLLQKAKGMGATYPNVPETINEIQERLLNQAKSALATERLKQAAELCHWGLKLGPHPGLQELRQTIEQQRAKRLDDLYQQIRRGLDTWDLAAARQAVDQAQKIAPDDDNVRALQKQVRQMETHIADLPERMNTGWLALRSCEYDLAQQTFDQIVAAAPSFREAQRWRLYTANLKKAITICQLGQWEKMPEIPKLLREAEKQLCMEPGEPLPALLPTLAEERKQAVWNTQQLYDLAVQMAALHQQYESLVIQAQIPQAKAMLPRIEEARQAILRRHESPTIPSSGYTAACKSEREAETYRPQPLEAPTSRWSSPAIETEDRRKDKSPAEQETISSTVPPPDKGRREPPVPRPTRGKPPRHRETKQGDDSEAPAVESQPAAPQKPTRPRPPDDQPGREDKTEAITRPISHIPEVRPEAGQDTPTGQDGPPSPETQPETEREQPPEEEEYDWSAMGFHWNIGPLPTYEEDEE